MFIFIFSLCNLDLDLILQEDQTRIFNLNLVFLGEWIRIGYYLEPNPQHCHTIKDLLHFLGYDKRITAEPYNIILDKFTPSYLNSVLARVWSLRYKFLSNQTIRPLQGI